MLWHSMEKHVSLEFVHCGVNKASVSRTQKDLKLSCYSMIVKELFSRSAGELCTEKVFCTRSSVCSSLDLKQSDTERLPLSH